MLILTIQLPPKVEEAAPVVDEDGAEDAGSDSAEESSSDDGGE
jgi:hypothetical protein